MGNVDYLHRLGDIPSCIPTPESENIPLRDWLRGFNQQVNKTSGTSDDSFSQEDYEFSLNQAWGNSIIQIFHGRQSYAAFSSTIDSYIERSRLLDPCLKSQCWERGGAVRETSEGWSCIERPKKPPPATPSKAVPKGLGRFGLASRPPWWSPNIASSSTASSTMKPVTFVKPPALEELLQSAQKEGAPLSEANQKKLGQMGDMILQTAQQQARRHRGKGGAGSGVDLFFAIDISGSMQVKFFDVLKEVPSILSSLKEKGASPLRVGIVLFSDGEDIRVLLPLSPARDESVIRGMLENQNPLGGTEPVGLASLTALKLFDARSTRKQLVVLTDADGIGDDQVYPQQFSDAAEAAKKAGIKVNLIKFEER
jgi:von Willebrand factor type A domain-containing protein